MHRFDAGVRSKDPPKAQWLCRAHAAGLPVPDGIVLPMDAAPPGPEDLEAILADGPLIVRAALHGEDTVNGSAAGLGASVAGLATSQAVYAALATVRDARADPWLVRYRGAVAHPGDAVLIQREVPRAALLVAALLPDGLDYVEVHVGAGEVLAQGQTPAFAGRVQRWDHPARSEVRACIEAIRTGLPPAAHGYDVELVVDPSARAHVVQVRPLTRDLQADATAFLEAVHAAGDGPRLRGVQVLDAEHNPAPLSPAHASLMAWLAEARPSSGGLVTLAGWLYLGRRVRELSGTPSAPVLSPLDALRRLRDVELVGARARLNALRDGLDEARHPELRTRLSRALDAFVAMIDVYLGVLVPVRAAAGRTLATAPEAPYTLRGRAAHADVLPAAWDIAAPALGELASFDTTHDADALPTDPVAAAVLLTEWDDHLFALGLAPLRHVYRAAGTVLGLGDRAFGLTLQQLDAALAAQGSADLGSPNPGSSYPGSPNPGSSYPGSPNPGTRIPEPVPGSFDPESNVSGSSDPGSSDPGSSAPGSSDPGSVADAALARTARWATLRPPAMLDEGIPLPALPRHHLRGIGFGRDVEGPLAQRVDLEDLLRRPPPPDAIVVLPALTAQAALALDTLGVRAVCCEHGGAMSHAALMMRELGLSGLVGCSGCTRLPEGTTAAVDVRTGRLQIASSVTLGS